MKKFVTKWEKKIYFYLAKTGTVEVIRTPQQDDWADYPPFIVRINASEQNILYDGDLFYIEMVNKDEQIKELELHKEEINKLKEAGKTEEEIAEFMKGRWTQYIDLVEFIIDNEETVNAVKKAITLL